MRSRNFWVRNEIVERGAITKSQKGKTAFVERKVEECYQWKATGHCSKGDIRSVRHDPTCGNKFEDHRSKGQSSIPAPNSKAQTGGQKPLKSSNYRGASPRRTWGKIPCRDFLGGKCTNSPCSYWRPPVCLDYKNPGANLVNNAIFDVLRLKRIPARSRRKVVRKDQLPCFWSLHNRVVSQDSYPRKAIRRNIGITTRRQILQGHVAPNKNSGKKGSIARNYSKV